jgi:hypothetical protein
MKVGCNNVLLLSVACMLSVRIVYLPIDDIKQKLMLVHGPTFRYHVLLYI